MELLLLPDVKIGMRLARAVFTKDGKLLLPPGEMLGEKQLQLLSSHDIKELMVDSAMPAMPHPRDVNAPEDILNCVRQLVQERFEGTDSSDPYLQAVFELAVERQGRLFLSCPGKVTLGRSSLPAFHAPCPPKASIKPLISKSHHMGTLPVVFHHLVRVLQNSASSIEEISEVITTDPTLTAKLLRLVNSPFYGLAYKIDTIPRAVVMVGTRQIIMLAMGTVLLTVFKGLPVSLINMQSFWTHSISTGVAARLIAKKVGTQHSESFFVAGLLHDIARLLIYTQLPKHALYILSEAKRRQEPVFDIERECLGFTHEELGRELLTAWHCPEELTERVATHHNLQPKTNSREEVILPLSNVLSKALGYGSSGETILPGNTLPAWKALGIAPEELVNICRKLDDSVRHLRSLFSAESE